MIRKISVKNVSVVVSCLICVVTLLLIWEVICLGLFSFGVLFVIILGIAGMSGLCIYLMFKSRFKKVMVGISLGVFILFFVGVVFTDKINSFFRSVSSVSDTSMDLDVLSEPFNIYVSGVDSYGDILNGSRSDVNMVISVNPNTKEILLTSIPRDYYVVLDGKSGYRDKMTHALLYGIDTATNTISNLLDIKINYYVKVNFSSIIDIVDAIGGIEVYSDYSFTSLDNYKYVKGINKLNGKKALSFVRERKAFAMGDRQRVKNQQALFKGIFDKCTSRDVIVKYGKLLDSLKMSFVTNMPIDKITSLIKMQISNNYSWSISSNSLDGDDGYNYTYTYSKYKSYVMMPDKNSISYAKSLINDLLDGALVVSKEDDDSFKVKLVRNSVSFDFGEEYIYHGYVATYDGDNISFDEIDEKFIINGKCFSDYRDLVYYVTYNLGRGSYIIKYNLSYMGITKILEQRVIIN